MSYDPLKDFFNTLNDLHTKQVEYPAIWMTKFVTTSVGHTMRIATGDCIRVENGCIVNVTEKQPATHKVVLCMGTLYNNFEFTIVNLETSEPSTLKV